MNTNTGKVLAWHFTDTDKRLRFGDKRQVRAGRTLKAKFPVNGCDKPTLCQAGMHASESILHALDYAPGPYLWRVELSGDVVRGDNKCVAVARKALWGFDATDLLLAFARRCALDATHLWDAPNGVRKFLETGDESLRAAAHDAAAAWAAAAAGAAARAAAGAAAWAAAGAAAWDAAGAAAWDAAWDAQTKALEELVTDYARSKGYVS